MNFFKSQSGFATIPTVLAISLLILAIGTGIAGLTFTEVMTTAVQQRSEEALFYANEGAQDGLMRVTRNKNYTCITVDCYSVDMVTGGCASGAGCAKVTVSAGTGTTADPKIITSKGIAQSNSRKVEIRVIFDDSGNGQISTTTWSELTD